MEMDTATDPIELSIIVPAYNEGRALQQTIDDLLKVFQASNIRFEIIVVDDASTDGCANHLESNARIQLKVVRHQNRSGSGASRKTGAKLAEGRWHAWIDADQTYAAADLSKLWNRRSPAAQSIGWRRNEAGHNRLARWFAKAILRLLASALYGCRIRDLNSGLRLIPSEHFKVWGHELPNGFSCATAATLGSLRHKQRIDFIPISYRGRNGERPSKFHPWFDSARMLRQIVLSRVAPTKPTAIVDPKPENGALQR